MSVKHHIHTWHPPANPRGTVWLVHGIGEHGGRYQGAAKVLTSGGFLVKAHDHRGHGLSTGPRGHISSWSEYRHDLVGLMERETDPALPVFLFGHSMGALVVLDFLLRDPGRVRAAVVSAPPVDSAAARKPLLVMASKVLSCLLPRLNLPLNNELDSLSRDSRAREAFKKDPLVHECTTARWGAECLRTIRFVQANRDRLNVPLLILQGQDDRINHPAGTRHFSAGLPASLAQYQELPGVRHELHTDPEVVALFSDIADWFAKWMEKS